MSDDLPGGLAEVAAIIGRDGALDLAEAWGGQRIYVPKPAGLGGANPLVQTLGNRLAMKLAERLAGDRLQIPRARRALVNRLVERGMSVPDAARRLGLDLSTAYRYRRLG